MASLDSNGSSFESSIYKGCADDYEHSCGQCLLDGKDVEAYGFCADCPEYLCVTCFRAHPRNRASRHHQLQKMSNAPNVKIEQVASKICTEICAVHRQEIVKYFCSKHEALCCNACVVLNHKLCEIDYIPEKCLEIDDSAEYKETINKLEARQKAVDEMKLAAKKVEEEIAVTSKSAMDEIQMFEQELLEQIGKLRKKAEIEVETKQTTNTQIVSTVLDTGKKMISNMQQLRKEIIESKKGNDLAHLFIAVKKAKRLFKSDDLNESIQMLGDTRTRIQFERNEDIVIESLGRSSACFGRLIGTVPIRRDAIISRRKRNKPVYVVALSIGSSGMTFGLSSVFDRERILCKTWVDGISLFTKVSTSLLINPDGQTVCAYGYEAEQKYEELVEISEESNYFYYHRGYILDIYRNMDKNITFVRDVSGKELSSILILSKLIGVLKDEAVGAINEQKFDFTESDIQFILTLPEIFEKASEALKVAAEKSGIKTENLTIVFETEAASMYIQRSWNNLTYRNIPLQQCQEGDRYLVLDARGRIFSTTVYEICQKKSTQIYHEIIEFNRVDSFREEFGKFLSNILGQDIVQKFRETFPEEYSELMVDTDEKLKNDFGDRDSINVRLTYHLDDLVIEFTGGTLKELLSKHSIHLNRGTNKCKIDLCTLKSFYQRAFSTITSQLHSVLLKKSVLGCGVVITLGSFSEYYILQESLKKEFPDLQVVVPPSPEMAVLRGAVALGHYFSKSP